MGRQRSIETSEQRADRVKRDADARKESQAAEEAAVDRMIRRNIEERGA